MKIGVVIPTFDQYANAAAFRRIVEALERLGFDSAWFGDHVIFPRDYPDYMSSDWMDAVTCAIHGLGLTSRLSFGTDVLVAAYRNPILLAKMAATAAQLSGGRLMVGLGSGWLAGEFEALGGPPFSARTPVLEEWLRVMRTLFETEGPATHQGKRISFDSVHFGPRLAVAPPLLVGGNHPNAIRRAALLGDGWHPLFMGAADYAGGRAEIERIRAEEGITRPYLFSYSAPQTRILPEGGAPVRTPSSQERSDDHESSYAPASPLDAGGRQRFIGTAAQLREDYATFAEAGVEQMLVRPAVPLDREIGIERFIEQIELFAADVLQFCHGLGR
jgi:alkanesulfonate monooxygenase SsuD/methylene tetrahydromethanopterin reductase-like flavin-dependent oxidoreductase (luciferase family)